MDLTGKVIYGRIPLKTYIPCRIRLKKGATCRPLATPNRPLLKQAATVTIQRHLVMRPLEILLASPQPQTDIGLQNIKISKCLEVLASPNILPHL